MSSISDAIAALNTSLGTLVPSLTNAVNRKVAQAALADNALALGGQSSSQLVATAASHTDAHANRTDNPHGVTAAQIGAYSQSQIDAMIAQLIPSGILPVSMFGNINGDVVDYVTVDGPNAKVNLVAGVPLLISGQYFALPALSVTIAKPGTTKLYAQLVSGNPQITASATAIAESVTNMFIGQVTLDASGNVTQNTIAHVVRLDNYRVSATSAGSAIPVSTGTPDATSHLAWQ